MKTRTWPLGRKTTRSQQKRISQRVCGGPGLSTCEDGAQIPRGPIRTGTPPHKQNPCYENKVYRQPVRHHPLPRSRRPGLGRSREQAHRTRRFRRNRHHPQCSGRTQGHEERRPSGQRLSLHPVKPRNAEPNHRPGAPLPGFFVRQEAHRRRCSQDSRVWRRPCSSARVHRAGSRGRGGGGR